MAAHLAIDLENVAKTYKAPFRESIHALRGIDMKVHRGEVFGLLGPNGAGKSTLVKILMTVIRPSQCKGTVLGQPVVVLRPREGQAPEFAELTKRELEVAALVAKGLRNREIAEVLGISLGTVKDHVHRVLAKSGLESRAEVAALWREI